jgi:hypothetical protein
MKINDAGLRKTFAEVAKDGKITRPEVTKLINSAYDSARVTPTEKADLKRMLAVEGDLFTAPARAALENFIGTLRPDGTHPQMSIDYNSEYASVPIMLNDSGLRSVWDEVAKDGRVTQAEVEKLIHSAYDSEKITPTEKADLERMLLQMGSRFTPAARTALETFLHSLRPAEPPWDGRITAPVVETLIRSATASGRQVTRPEVEKLIRSGSGSDRITLAEKAELKRTLLHKSPYFTPAARTELERFIATLQPDGT